MALLDIFKKKKKIIKKEETQRAETHPLPKVRPRKKVSEAAWRVLSSPHITEKATGLEKKNKYVFKVFSGANKIEIKKAIEELYGVNVIGVETINVPRRKRRLGRQEGWKKGYKKAIIKIKEGQKIEILPR